MKTFEVQSQIPVSADRLHARPGAFEGLASRWETMETEAGGRVVLQKSRSMTLGALS